METTMEAPPVSTPDLTFTSYAIGPRPNATRKGTNIPTQLAADLAETIKTQHALTFSTEGLSEQQVSRMAARLHNVGRRIGEYGVRTRKQDGLLFAWAVPRRKQSKKAE